MPWRGFGEIKFSWAVPAGLGISTARGLLVEVFAVCLAAAPAQGSLIFGSFLYQRCVSAATVEFVQPGELLTDTYDQLAALSLSTPPCAVFHFVIKKNVCDTCGIGYRVCEKSQRDTNDPRTRSIISNQKHLPSGVWCLQPGSRAVVLRGSRCRVPRPWRSRHHPHAGPTGEAPANLSEPDSGPSEPAPTLPRAARLGV